jgi:dipeptidyl aminopeptidase/acylaminoacyl peptidase
MSHPATATLLWAVVCATAAAQTTTRDHRITLEDCFGLAWISDCAVSPDGRHVAYVERRWDTEADRRDADLWVVAIAPAGGSHPRTRLTFGRDDDHSPAWSADGRFIYFLREPRGGEGPETGRARIWRVSLDGGALLAVTDESRAIERFELAPDGRSLYFVMGRKEFHDDPWKELRRRFEAMEYGHGVFTAGEVWALDLESWRSRKLVDPGRVIVDLAASPDGQKIAMVTRPDDTLLSHEGWSTVDVWDAATGSITTLPDAPWRAAAPSPYGWIVSPCWSADSRALAFRVDFDGYPAEAFVASFGAAAGTVDRIVKVPRPGEVSLEGRMRWLPGSPDLCVLAEDRARARIIRLHDASSGAPRGATVLTPGDLAVETFSLDRTGTVLAYVAPGLDHPGDLFARTIGPTEAPRRLTAVNPQVDSWMLPSIRVVSWTGAEGKPVEGILELPPGHEKGAPLPMVVEIHGGPTASTKYAMSFSMYGRTLFPALGWALLSPNYRGSTGYGDAFLTDLVGHENDVEVRDILAGVDAMVERGIADPQRLAVIGWSNGGYLVNCLIASDGRFRAASSGAGVLDMVMQWAIEDTPGHVINYARGLPWEVTAEMRRMSPLEGLSRVETPTLIHAGAEDDRVPAAHGRGLHRALHRYLGVPCELVVYPGAGHSLSALSHRRAKLAWDVAWFDAHVLGRAAGNPGGPGDTGAAVPGPR